MTNSYEDKYVIKASSSEEIQSMIDRIESLYSPPPSFTVRQYGLGFEDQSIAETLIDDLRLNREGKLELSLEVNAPQASIAVSKGR